MRPPMQTRRPPKRNDTLRSKVDRTRASKLIPLLVVLAMHAAIFCALHRGIPVHSKDPTMEGSIRVSILVNENAGPDHLRSIETLKEREVPGNSHVSTAPSFGPRALEQRSSSGRKASRLSPLPSNRTSSPSISGDASSANSENRGSDGPNAGADLLEWRSTVTAGVIGARGKANSTAENAVAAASGKGGGYDFQQGSGANVSASIAKAFESALGAGSSPPMLVDSQTLSDGTRVERFSTGSRNYCVKIPNRQLSIDPFNKSNTALMPYKC